MARTRSGLIGVYGGLFGLLVAFGLGYTTALLWFNHTSGGGCTHTIARGQATYESRAKPCALRACWEHVEVSMPTHIASVELRKQIKPLTTPQTNAQPILLCWQEHAARKMIKGQDLSSHTHQ